MNIKNKESRPVLLQVTLFIITLITTTLAGSEWISGKFIFFTPGYSWVDFAQGFHFSIPFLGILTIHEMGHYLTSRWYKIKTTLPYYLPAWFGFIGLPSIGTLGAVIKIQGFTRTRQQYFDIGIAGPLAGFVAALAVLFYGFTHLPPQEHIYSIHPEYEQYGADYAQHVYSDTTENLILGTNLIFEFFKQQVADPELLPNDNELMHYPYIFAGFLALFFTALNLIPVGQLDGGHVLYGLIGPKGHKYVASGLFVVFVFMAGLGVITPFDETESLLFNIPLYIGFLYLVFHTMPLSRAMDKLLLAVALFTLQFVIAWINPTVQGFDGWLLFAFVIGRFLGVQHPPVYIDKPLDTKRIILGYLALLIFVLCFSPTPLAFQ
ncbi:site-2 protease family protein [Cytophagales bacterium LB-30]|uniref:Site-2 protease family protein n=1 Tax=Shiella aurantiaca TaxID=3058365 RepID=A0ABT8F441_9BACT|nr:site-2 protease family protein [Shiella aurantiaca]MDN4165220.1 site-2 protease family protein [Shiella aurantiaca]